jgi:hypothetical protein
VSDALGSPKAARLGSPSWLDGRLVLGVLLVLVSVLIGAKVLAGADASQLVWVASHDLAPGTVLADADLHEGKVRLYGTSGLYLAGGKPTGYVVQRPISADELVPAGALSRPGERLPRREVTVPVAAGHLPPDLSSSDQVDVYLTPGDKAVKRTTAKDGFASRLVLTGVTVVRVTRTGGLGSSAQDQPVVVSVDPEQVLVLVQAMADGAIDLVRVPRNQQRPLTTASPAP